MRSPTFPDCNENWTPADGRVVLEQWRQSGESMAEFARQHGVTASRLYSLKDRLGRRPKSQALVPAAVVTAATGIPTVAVQLRNGMAIEISNASPSWVAAMVLEIERTES